jgi:hypothetical protein
MYLRRNLNYMPRYKQQRLHPEGCPLHFYELTPRRVKQQRRRQRDALFALTSSAFCAGQTAGSGFSATDSLKFKMLNSTRERANKVVDVGRSFQAWGFKADIYNSKVAKVNFKFFFLKNIGAHESTLCYLKTKI